MPRVIPIVPTKPPAPAPAVAATVITGPARGAPGARPGTRPATLPATMPGKGGAVVAKGAGGAPSPATAAEAAKGAAASSYFRNYTQMPQRVPAWLWVVLRVGTLAVTLGLAWALIEMPQLGLLVFWGLAIPLLPALLVVAPGLWRQVCPMATLNQLPRTLKRGRALDLPSGLKNWAFAIALVLFIGAVAMRQPWLNHSGLTVGVVMLAMLTLALAGGWFFKGRSGWCGTFCPLGPIQRAYGQAPLVLVRNGHCEPCVGCQKNCYDFNPRAAVFSDVYDDDPRYASQRRLFMGLLPGLLLGYFLAQPLGLDGVGEGLALLLGASAASAGLYGLTVAFVPANAYRISLAFGAAAITIFYIFAGPIVVASAAQLIGGPAPEWLTEATRGMG